MPNSSRFHTLKTLFIALALGMAGALPAHAEIRLVFGTYAADKPSKTVRKFKPFLAYLADSISEKLGEQVIISMQISQQYAEGIDALVQGRVDFARFGPASYVLAKNQEDGIEIIAMESKKGAKTFKGVIAVRADNPIRSLAELRNGSFAFGSKLSTIGRYLAQKELMNVGISAEDLKHFAYLGRHDRVGTAVGKGDFDAGALKASTFNDLKAKNVPIRSLVSFDNVTKPWLARSGLDPIITATMREVMLDLTDPAILKSVSKSGFLSGTDEDYRTIRDAMERSRGFGG